MAGLVIDDRDGHTVIAVRSESGEIEMPALWLRERSTQSGDRDARTGQRLFDPHLLPADLAVTRASIDIENRLQVMFSDGHTVTFDPDDLISDLTHVDGLPARRHWTADMCRPARHDWSALDQADAEFDALADFLRDGVILLTGVPAQPGTVRGVAAKFGYIRETNFGTVFDVYSQPDSNDLAYRSIALGPHTDNPYRVPAPGIQLLHCLANDALGGLSTMVDGLAVIGQLDDEDPSAVDLLASVPLRFRFRDERTEIVSIRPMIERNHARVVTGLHYSPRFDELPLLRTAELRKYQAARGRLAELLQSEAYEIQFRLSSGDVAMFDNARILHGRTSFDADQGARHLQGCYIDLDGPQSRFRVLARMLRRSVDAAMTSSA